LGYRILRKAITMRQILFLTTSRKRAPGNMSTTGD
jgi:hypothetical protein